MVRIDGGTPCGAVNGHSAGRLLLTGAFVILFAACGPTEAEQAATTITRGGDPGRGEIAIERYGCGSCHTIPGVNGANGLVGPPLNHIARRLYLAGQLPNTAENLMTWIQHPQKIEPKTVMPQMGVTDRDARDIAAYLYTLR